MGTHSAFGERSHTRAYTAKQGASLPRPQRGFALPVNPLLFRRAFIYIHFPVLCEPPSSSRGGKSSKTAVTNAVPDRFSSRFLTSPTNGPRSLSQAKAGTHSAFGEGSHTAACTPKQGAFRMGVVSLLSERSARSPTSPGRVSERQTLPLLGLGRVCSRRTQKAYGTAMCLCASLSRRRRGPAGLRDLFLLLSELWLTHHVFSAFRMCETRGGITTLGVLCVLLKRRTAACQSG